MLQTICHIPREFLDIPVFGWGWALWIWMAVSGVILTRMIRTHGWSGETLNFLPTVALFALILLFVAPHLEDPVRGPDGAPQGIAIRGYGVMLLLAVIVGVGLAIHRAQSIGMPADIILSLAFWMFLLAILGARMFFVIQKWEQYSTYRGGERIVKILNLTQGGLVVYGALIGALIAVIWFTRRHGIPLLALLDLIAPSMVLGLAIGRIGCLLNGCCYGGLCDHDFAWGITFPAEAPPYYEQQRRGYFHGIAIERDVEGQPIVRLLDADGPAARAGLADGQVITAVRGADVNSKEVAEQLAKDQPVDWEVPYGDPVEVARELVRSAEMELALTTADGRDFQWTVERFPARSLPVHATQLYSSLNALLIFFVLYTLYPFRRRDGVVVALLLTVYPITRFLLELIRNDEGAFAGTRLTISQNVSLILVAVAIGLWAYVMRQPRVTAWPTHATTPSPSSSGGP